MAVVFSNNATTTLTSNISSGATSITVADGSVFPALSGSDYTYLTFEAPLTNDKEIVKLTARSGNTLTVVRAQDGTSASAFSAGDKCELRITAALLNDLNTEADTESVSRAGDSMTGNLSFGDNNKAIFGAGSDLEIYSDGTSGIIQQVASGVLLLKGQDFYVQNDAGSNYIRAQGSAQVDLYYGGVKKFETTSTGIDVTGTVVADGLESSGNLSFTAADGIDISGKESVIIRIDSDDNDAGRVFQVRSGPTSSEEILLQASEDAGVFLYYDNAVKLSTTNTGIDVTGGMNVGNITSTGDLSLSTDNATAYFGAGLDLRIYHDGSDSYIKDAGAGNLYLDSSDTIIRANGTENSAKFIGNGRVELYYDAVKKFETTATGIDVTGTATVDALTSSGSITATGQTIFAGVGNFSSGLSVSGTYSTTIGTNVIAFSRDGTSYIDQSSTNGNGMIVFRLGSTYDQRLNIGNSAVVLNEESDDVDFRVESNSNTNMLFVDAGNNAVALGTTDIDNQNNSAGSAADNGFAYNLGSGGYLSVARYGGTVAYLNRTDSDGTILDIRKDGSTVGTLGSNTARFFIHNNYGTGSGFRFDNGFITPSSATGAAEDNTTDLGSSSARFKDLFLSGTANAGGLEVEAATPVLEIDSTASANLATLQFTTSGTVDSKITHQASSGDMVIESGRNSTWGGKIYLKTDTFQNAVFTRTTSTFNENSADIDFRVESNGATHMLFVDAGNDRVGVNESAPDSPLHVKRSAVSNSWSPYAGTTLTLEENSGNGNILQFMSDNAATGEVWFGDDDSRNAGRIRYEHDNNKLELWTNGTERLSINSSGAATFNSSVTTGGEVSIAPSTGTAKLRLTSQGIGSEVFTVNGQIPGVANGGFAIRNETDSRNDFFIDAVGATTLGYNLTIGGNFLAESSATLNSTIRATGNNTRAIGNYQAHDSSGNDVNMVMGVFGDANRAEVSTNTNHTLRLYVNNTPSKYLEIATTGQVFTSHGMIVNEDSNDSDFRVESNNQANMLVVDASADKVGIGGSAGDTTLTVRGSNNSAGDLYTAVGAGNVPGIVVQNAGTTDNNSAAVFFKNDAAVVASVGARFVSHSTEETELRFSTTNSSGTTRERVFIKSDGTFNVGTATDLGATANVLAGTANNTMYDAMVLTGGANSTSGSGARLYISGTANDPINRGTIIEGKMTDNGNTHQINFYTSGNSQTPTRRMHISHSEIVANDDSVDMDFRVESDNQSHMLFVDAGNDKIGINQSNPAAALDIVTTVTAGADAIRLRQPSSSETYQIQMGVSGQTNNGLYIRNTASTGQLQSWTAGEIVINDDSVDRDFRVESNNNFTALYVDAGNDRIGIFEDAPAVPLHITTTTTGETVRIESTNAGGGAGPILALDRNSSSPADADEIGRIYFYGRNDANERIEYGLVLGIIEDVSDGSEDSTLHFYTYINGAQSDRIKLEPSGMVINESSKDSDFRVESDSNTHMLFLDAANDVVTIGGTVAETGDTFEVLSGDTNTIMRIRNTNAGDDGPILVFDKASASPANDDNVGDIRFIGRDSAGNAEQFARLLAESSNVTSGAEDAAVSLEMMVNGTNTQMYNHSHVGTVFNDQSSADLDFRVESDNNSNAVFVNAGTDSVHFGTSGNFGGSRMNVEHPTDCFGLNLGPNASGQRFLLYFNYNGTPIGSVKGESTGVTYNTTSDRRLKKDIETITDGTDKLMAMNPVTHRWKADPEADAVHGFIAQEMMDIVPEAVSGDPEGEEMMSMDYGRITPVLVAALQDAHQKIAELETRLNELEGK